jgi:hypothetical protein
MSPADTTRLSEALLDDDFDDIEELLKKTPYSHIACTTEMFKLHTSVLVKSAKQLKTIIGYLEADRIERAQRIAMADE